MRRGHPAFFRRLASKPTVFEMMRRAELECIAAGRPVSPILKAWHPGDRDVPQKWRDEAMEHLAGRS